MQCQGSPNSARWWAKKKKKVKEKGEEKSKRKKNWRRRRRRRRGRKRRKERNERNGSLDNFFERWGADKVSPRGAIVGKDRRLSLFTSYSGAGASLSARTTPFLLVYLPRSPPRAFYSLPAPGVSPFRDLVMFGRSSPVSRKRLARLSSLAARRKYSLCLSFSYIKKLWCQVLMEIVYLVSDWFAWKVIEIVSLFL